MPLTHSFMLAEQVMTSEDYSLIQGLPGTGKSEVITFVARLLAAHGKRVLITAYTHSAVDNVMLKLMEKGLSSTCTTRPSPALLRVGRSSSCHSGVRPILVSSAAMTLEPHYEQTQVKHSSPSAELLRKVVKSACIVGVTALSIPRSPLLLGEHFDVVIVDEAGQISEPAVLGALMAADSFVLVGDHQQLPPLVISALATQGGKSNSCI
jgi:DNA replication ATP-dependent helicase Dna2